MANHRQNGTNVRLQIVMSAPKKLLVEHYLSPKGKQLLWDANTKADKKAVWDKYGKNRYRINPESVPCRNKIGGVKMIIHS